MVKKNKELSLEIEKNKKKTWRQQKCSKRHKNQRLKLIYQFKKIYSE